MQRLAPITCAGTSGHTLQPPFFPILNTYLRMLITEAVWQSANHFSAGGRAFCAAHHGWTMPERHSTTSVRRRSESHPG